MRYKITITTPDKKIAEQLHDMIQNHKLYAKNHKPVQLSDVTEICDECSKRGC